MSQAAGIILFLAAGALLALAEIAARMSARERVGAGRLARLLQINGGLQ